MSPGTNPNDQLSEITPSLNIQSETFLPSNPSSSPEDISWSVVFPTISTPPTSSLTASGTQLTPRTVIEQSQGDQNSEEGEVIIASSIEEPFDEDDLDGVVDLTQGFDHNNSNYNNDNNNNNNERIRFETEPLTSSISTLVSNSKAAVLSEIKNTPSILLKQQLVGLQSLKQHLFFNRSTAINPSFVSSSVSSSQKTPWDLSHSQAQYDKTEHHSREHSASETFTAVGISESISVTDNETYQHHKNFQHLKTKTAKHINGTEQRITSSTSRHCVSQSVDQSIQHCSSVYQTPLSLEFQSQELHCQYPSMVPQHPTSAPPLKPSNTLPMSQSYVPYNPSTSLSLADHHDPLSQHHVARAAYTPVAPPHRDYATDMSRVANAAYTKAFSDVTRMMQYARAPQPQPIVIQNTTKAVADAQNEYRTTGPPPKRSTMDRWIDFLQDFWSSKLNRVLVFGLAGAGIYLYWEWWQHHRRMQFMRRRIEANPLLRLGQIISGVADSGPRHSPRYYS